MPKVSPVRLAVEVVLAASAAAIGSVDPAAGVAVAAALPVGLSATSTVLDRIATRRANRQSVVLTAAARLAGVHVDELTDRLEADESREQLFLRTVAAAGHVSTRDKLIAYAIALANGSASNDEAVSWETTFVRALDDLDSEQLRLLERFTQTAEQLGLAGPEAGGNRVMATLNEHQVEMVSIDILNLPSALAVLQRHGLLASRTLGGGTLGGGSGTTHWVITNFGTSFIERLKEIGEVLRSDGPPP